MADVVERLPFPISKKLASTVADIVSRNGREIHYTLAGVPFRLASSPDMPATFETAPGEKTQQDTEPEAGEQTFSGWWLRSQASWHEGAGSKYPETSIGQGLRVSATAGFYASSNVDVWTPGELKLMKRTSLTSAPTTNRCIAVMPVATNLSVVAGRVGSVTRVSNLDDLQTALDLYVNASVTFTHVVATEQEWFAAGDDGKVYSGPIGSTTTTPKVWTLTGAGTGPTRIGWAKHRLWATNGNKIYAINYATPGATASAYNHPSTAWTYTDIADAPGGVLFGGYGDGTSHIQRIALNTDGSVPVLSAATTLAVLPSDEKALRINSLAGSMVCILTNMGVRVAVADASGNLTYGPLFLQRDKEVPETAIPSIASAGRFWWLCFGDEAKLWRVDSSTELEGGGVFAYASDMECPSTPVSISVRKERAVAVGVAGVIYFQSIVDLCQTGWIQTGRIKFRTDEFKTYHYVDVTAAPLQGTVSLDFLNDADTEARVITWNTPGVALVSAQVPSQIGPQRFASVKLTLQVSATDSVVGPVIGGVRVKALPAQKPQRVYTIPFECYDQEQWSTGQREGYEGFARDRYLAVRAAEDAGGVALLVNYKFPSPTGELCRIELVKFIQFQQPDSVTLDGGFGGILAVTLRTLT